MRFVRPCSGWGLPCPRRRRRGGELLPRLFTLAPRGGCACPGGRCVFCGTVLRSPGVAVGDHPALRSPDFPPLRWPLRAGAATAASPPAVIAMPYGSASLYHADNHNGISSAHSDVKDAGGPPGFSSSDGCRYGPPPITVSRCAESPRHRFIPGSDPGRDGMAGEPLSLAGRPGYYEFRIGLMAWLPCRSLSGF
jgi:hypothetical protein